MKKNNGNSKGNGLVKIPIPWNMWDFLHDLRDGEKTAGLPVSAAKKPIENLRI